MSFIIQTFANFSRYLNRRKVFVEGFIYQHDLQISPEEKREIAGRFDISGEVAASLSRNRIESEIVLTMMNEDNTLRVAKISVESRQLLGNRDGLERTKDLVRRNLEKAIDITIEKLFDLGAWGAETGLLEQPGLKDALCKENGSKVNWWRLDRSNGVLTCEAKPATIAANSKLLMEILDKAASAAA